MNSFDLSYYKPIMDMEDLMHIIIFVIYYVVVIKFLRSTIQDPATVVDKIDASQNLEHQLEVFQAQLSKDQKYMEVSQKTEYQDLNIKEIKSHILQIQELLELNCVDEAAKKTDQNLEAYKEKFKTTMSYLTFTKNKQKS